MGIVGLLREFNYVMCIDRFVYWGYWKSGSFRKIVLFLLVLVIGVFRVVSVRFYLIIILVV